MYWNFYSEFVVPEDATGVVDAAVVIAPKQLTSTYIKIITPCTSGTFNCGLNYASILDSP